jgi:hypothetical protein
MQVGDANEGRGTRHAADEPKSVKISGLDPQAVKQMGHHRAASDGTDNPEPNHRGPAGKPSSRQ